MKTGSKYNIVLTVILIIVILGIVALLVYLGIDFYRNYKEKNEGETALGQFENYIETNQNNITKENTTNDQENEEAKPTNNNTSSGSSGNKGTLTYKGYKILGKIEIPKIKIKYSIFEETPETLKMGIGFVYGPGLNKLGNNILIGHNFNNGTFFSNNYKLEKGDKIYITDLTGTRIEYRITKKYKTNPEDFDYAVRDTKGKKEISLSTCTNNTSSRIVIWAEET